MGNRINSVGCYYISKMVKSKASTKKVDDFIARAKVVHGDFYDYSKAEYTTLKAKVCIICPIHGDFVQTPEKHIYAKTRCPACAGRPVITTEVFITRAKTVHEDRYDYTLTNYINDTTKVQIICKLHGVFMQAPGHHVHKKQGCPKCKHEAAKQRCKNNIGGYNEFTIGDELGWFYFVRVDNPVDQFVKIGITKQEVTKRLKGIGGSNGYDVIIACYGPLLKLYQIEQAILQSLTHIRYHIRPQHRAAKIGWTECFKLKDEHLVRNAVHLVCEEFGVDISMDPVL